MNFAPCTWQDIAPDLTADNARAYAQETDKLVFCADLTGLSVDSRLIIRFEDELEALAKKLGYL